MTKLPVRTPPEAMQGATLNQNIISAIEQKRLLQLQYKSYNRIVEPHAYGVDDNGIAKLRCYQTSGGSKSSSPSDWKLLNVSDILAMQVMDQVFRGHRADYKINDSVIVRMFAQLPMNGHADWRG